MPWWSLALTTRRTRAPPCGGPWRRPGYVGTRCTWCTRWRRCPTWSEQLLDDALGKLAAELGGGPLEVERLIVAGTAGPQLVDVATTNDLLVVGRVDLVSSGSLRCAAAEHRWTGD